MTTPVWLIPGDPAEHPASHWLACACGGVAVSVTEGALTPATADLFHGAHSGADHTITETTEAS